MIYTSDCPQGSGCYISVICVPEDKRPEDSEGVGSVVGGTVGKEFRAPDELPEAECLAV